MASSLLLPARPVLPSVAGKASVSHLFPLHHSLFLILFPPLPKMMAGNPGTEKGDGVILVTLGALRGQ